MVEETPHKVRSSISSTAIKITAATIFFTLLVAVLLSKNTTQASTVAQAARAKNPLPATETNIALGLDHFDAHCASCHGAAGKGDTELGKKLGAADLTSEKTQSKSDAEVFGIISRGIQGTAMPAFGKTHSATEIWHTVLFLRKLPTLTAEERKKLEAAIPAGARHKHGAHDEHPDQHVEPGGGHQHEDATKPPKQRQQPTAEHQHEGATKPATQAQHPTTEHQHQQGEQPAATKQEMPGHDMSKMGAEHTGHDMGNMGGHDMNAMMTTITGGPFKSMTAIGSGTSLQPSTTPGYMWHWMKGDWMIMAHGDLKAGFNHQGDPRGVNKAESQNWFMLMAERQAGPGRLMLRGMLSAEPWTAPNRGFPELFQTGETFKGRPIIDAQHPHDLFMELAAAYNIQLSENVALNFYGGPVAEPALGPVAFMHRMSAAENPAAPLGHHWQDSTHIAHGVLTAGVTAWRFRIESSLFHGSNPLPTG